MARNRQFAALDKVYRSRLRRSASGLAGGDRDLMDDLVQEGLMAMWRLDPALLQRAKNPKGVVKRAIRRAQIGYLRRHELKHTRRTIRCNIRVTGHR